MLVSLLLRPPARDLEIDHHEGHINLQSALPGKKEASRAKKQQHKNTGSMVSLLYKHITFTGTKCLERF